MFSALNQALNGPRRMLWTFSAVLAVAGGVMYKAKQSVDARRKADLEAFRAGGEGGGGRHAKVDHYAFMTHTVSSALRECCFVASSCSRLT
ncbi:hypothetical protein HDZ31DRAFT_64964 [Schizophyllum fasciatum]